MRRALELQGVDATLELSKVTCIKAPVKAEMIHLDKLADGTWRLIYSEKTIPDIKLLTALLMVREE